MKINEILIEAKSAHPQQAAKAIAMKKAGIKPKNESVELEEEFDLIESIIERLAQHNGVDAEVIWEDLETLTEDELYAFAVTSEPIMESQGVAEAKADSTGTWVVYNGSKVTKFKTREGAKAYAEKNGGTVASSEYYHDKIQKQDVAEDTQQVDSLVTDALRVMKGPDVSDAVLALKRVLGDRAYNERRGFYSFYVDQIHDMYGQQGVAEDWQKANKRDKTDGMSQKAVNAYRRENPGSKLKTAVTTKPGKLKKGGKASKRRKSYCSRSRGQMKMHSISCAKTPDKAICKARRRWNC